MGLREKKEVAVDAFRNTYDKELAYTKAGCTEEEIVLLEQDTEFQERLTYYLIEQKEELVLAARRLLESEDPKISYNAIFKLGELIYPEFFLKTQKKQLFDLEDVASFFLGNVNGKSANKES